MKKYKSTMSSIASRLIYVVSLGSVIVLTSCDMSDFGVMNKSPNAVSEPNPEFLFTSAQLDAVSDNYVGGAYLTIAQAMQQFATYKEVPAAGDKYFNDGYSEGNWSLYSGALSTLKQVIRGVSEQPEDVNKLSIARIWQVYIFSRLTDLYGDIPYSEASRSLVDGITQPTYDKQSFIYKDMLKELEESIRAFNPDMPSFGSSDLIYGGDIDKWRKFAYSMMLRLGMRLTEVDEQLAKEWVQKAIDGGVILDDDEIALIQYVDGSNVHSRNFIASGLRDVDYLDPQDEDNIEGGKYAETFINYLKTTDDPRLNVISVVWVETDGGERVPDTSTAIQKGMPNAEFNAYPPDYATYSEPHPETILGYDNPYLVLTNAEMYLLLAEASIRGWYEGSAEEAYEKAVRAGMRQWALMGSSGVISTDDINAYLAENPFKATSAFEEKMEQIQTQKWVTLSIHNEYEIFSNWRRTGYPELVPTNYPGNLTGGTIPTRFVIPDSELIYNTENFTEARDRQGGNSFTTKVWWDVE